MKILCLSIAIVFCVDAQAIENGYFLESAKKADKKALFSSLVKEATRIDGDALWCRRNRTEPWTETTAKLEASIKQDMALLEFGRILQRLDATYPSLHAKIELPEELDYKKDSRNFMYPLSIGTEVSSLKSGGKFVLDYVLDTHKWNGRTPLVGDEVIKINGKPMTNWSDEGFHFCKFALKPQCDIEFFRIFKSGLVSYKPLSEKGFNITLKRQSDIWNVRVPIVERNHDNNNNEGNASCKDRSAVYKDYNLVFDKGVNLCLYEHKRRSDLALMRIPSFVPEERNGDYFSPYDEAKTILPYWQKVSSKYKKLIIDVTGNHGGDIPGPISALVLTKPFQDQWMQFRKTKEFEDPDFRGKHFTDGRMTEKAYEKLGVWSDWQRIKYGDYLPPLPQFCVPNGTDCLSDLYEPEKHNFKGKISVVVDQWCVSSCSGFIWTLKNYSDAEKIEFVGFPDSADTTYERFRINAWATPQKKQGFSLSIQPRRYKPEIYRSMLLASWSVSATRTVDAKGRVLSMIPLKIDHFIPWEINRSSWLAKALKVAESQ